MKELKKLVLLAALVAVGVFTLKAETASSLKVGDVSPEIYLADANQVKTSLSSLRGNLVLLRFWASWDQISRKSNQDVVWLYNNHKNKKYNGTDGLLVYNVSLDTDKAKWANAIREDQMGNFYNVNDFESEYVTPYNVKDLPTSFLLDENGVVIGRDLNVADMNRMIAGKYAAAYPLANKSVSKKALAQPLKNTMVKALKPGEAYRIQLGAFKTFSNSKFFNVTKFGQISSEKTASGMTRVLLGDYNSIEAAASALQNVRQEGYSEAFVVMYRNNSRVKIVNKKEVTAALSNLNSYQTVANTTNNTVYEQPLSYTPPSQQGLDYWESQSKVGAVSTQRTGVEIDPFDTNTTYTYQQPVATTPTIMPTQPASYGVSEQITTVYEPQQTTTTRAQPYQNYSTQQQPVQPSSSSYASGGTTYYDNNPITPTTSTTTPYIPPSKSRFNSTYTDGGSSQQIATSNTTAITPYSGGTYRATSRTVSGSTNTPVDGIPIGTVGRSHYKPTYGTGISNSTITRGTSTNMRYQPTSSGGGTANTMSNTSTGTVVYTPSSSTVISGGGTANTMSNTSTGTVVYTPSSSTSTVQGSGNTNVSYGTVSPTYTQPATSVPMANTTVISGAQKSRGGNSSSVLLSNRQPTSISNYVYTNSTGRRINVPKAQLGVSTRTYKKEELPVGIQPYDPNKNHLIGGATPAHSTGNIISSPPPASSRSNYYSSPVYTRPVPGPTNVNRQYNYGGGQQKGRTSGAGRTTKTVRQPNSAVISKDGGDRNVVSQPPAGKTKVTEVGGNLDDALDAYLNSYEGVSTTVNTSSPSTTRTELTNRQKKRLIKKMKRNRNK